jgi:hypothetical protein
MQRNITKLINIGNYFCSSWRFTRNWSTYLLGFGELRAHGPRAYHFIHISCLNTEMKNGSIPSTATPSP